MADWIYNSTDTLTLRLYALHLGSMVIMLFVTSRFFLTHQH